MANLNSKWTRWMAVSCSHGVLADPVALEAALAFKRVYQPERVIHLGDIFDFAALRSGAKGTADEGISLVDDVTAGTQFVEALEPTDIFEGNHDVRVRRYIDSPHAAIAYAARHLCGELDDLTRKLKASWTPYAIETGWKIWGGCRFGHGYMYNQMAIRDHAEAFGKCVIGHLHRVGQERGRAINSPTAYCVGFLGDKAKFTYADVNRNKMAWSQGFAWGEYNQEHCIVRLEENSPAGWRLPL